MGVGYVKQNGILGAINKEAKRDDNKLKKKER
jgi:hypothetical protein